MVRLRQNPVTGRHPQRRRQFGCSCCFCHLGRRFYFPAARAIAAFMASSVKTRRFFTFVDSNRPREMARAIRERGMSNCLAACLIVRPSNPASEPDAAVAVGVLFFFMALCAAKGLAARLDYDVHAASAILVGGSIFQRRLPRVTFSEMRSPCCLASRPR